MKLKCKNNKLQIPDDSLFSTKTVEKTVTNLTIGKVYTIMYAASFTTIHSNCLTFYNDNNQWQEIRYNTALDLFEPVD